MSKDNGEAKPGDKEIILASEEVTRRNILAIAEHAKETRRMTAELLNRVDTLQNNLMSRERELGAIKKQLAYLQQKMFSKGTQDGD